MKTQRQQKPHRECDQTAAELDALEAEQRKTMPDFDERTDGRYHHDVPAVVLRGRGFRVTHRREVRS